MIEFRNVSYAYPNGQKALRNISLNLASGSMHFLIGRTGSGKSTLIRLLMAMMRPQEGQLQVASHNINAMSLQEIAYYRRQIGFIFQSHMLIASKSVFENVAMPLIIRGFSPDRIQRRVLAALGKVHLEHKSGEYPVHLSLGEQQRVCIARAVVAKPSILLADEPTGNLDHQLAVDIMRLFTAFNNVGTTVLIATHDESIINRFPARQIHLHQGRLA